MADDPRPDPHPDPRIDLGLTDEGKPVVLLDGSDDQAGSMEELLRFLPGLAAPGRATDLALAANHFAHGSEYRVITDPPAFEEAYRARLAREDANATWREGVVRLRDYGVPDFADVHAPRLEGGRLVFCAADTYLGVPYRAEASDLLRPPSYTPLPLTPLPAPPPPRPARPGPKPLTPEERAARRTHMPDDLPAAR